MLTRYFPFVNPHANATARYTERQDLNQYLYSMGVTVSEVSAIPTSHVGSFQDIIQAY